jgi:hypothetical protein
MYRSALVGLGGWGYGRGYLGAGIGYPYYGGLVYPFWGGYGGCGYGYGCGYGGYGYGGGYGYPLYG